VNSEKKVVILNGPPGSGKDTLAGILAQTYIGGVHLEFKQKLFALTKMIYGVSDDVWDGLYSRESKETPHPLFGGLSPRQALIKVSEEVIKPNFGKSYFGEQAAVSLSGQIHFFSDGGFVEEVKPIINKIGAENVLIIRLSREGCDFSSDSRMYLPDDIGCSVVDIENTNGRVVKTVNEIMAIVETQLLNW